MGTKIERFDPRTEDIIRRLAAISQAKPRLDPQKAEQALKEHFVRLGMKPLPVLWVPDAKAGYFEVFKAAESAAWSAAWSAARSAAIEKWIGIWLPFLEASEAGLWLFFVTEKCVVAVPRPSLLISGNRLHCDDGPAVSWPKGDRYWFLHGVQVTRQIVETPAEELDPRLLLKERNAEVRREIVRKIGIERASQRLTTKILDRQGDYELLNLDLGDGRSRPYLKMRNPSLGVWHIEGVAPHITTVQQAINWRAGHEETIWKPEVLT